MTPILAAALICTSPGPIDGDTWTCAEGYRVRAWGINAPEKHEPAGPAATRALSRIITGKTLTCEPKGKSYNRTVARCFIGKLDVAGEMVRQGHAVDWPKFSGGEYAR